MKAKHKDVTAKLPTATSGRRRDSIFRLIVRTVSGVCMIAFFGSMLWYPFYLPYTLLLLSFCTYYEILHMASASLRVHCPRLTCFMILTAWSLYLAVLTANIDLPEFLGKFVERVGSYIVFYAAKLSPSLANVSFTVLRAVQNSLPYIFNKLYSLVISTFFLLVLLLRVRDPFLPILSFCGWIMGGLFLTGLETRIITTVQKDGMYFYLPSVLVVANDTFAYILGKLLGRHSLVRVSPSKTWEGYIGAGIATLIFSHFWAIPLIEKFGGEVFKSRLDADAAIQAATMAAAATKAATHGAFLLGNNQLSRMYICCMLLALWISIVGPVGGMLASLAKRCAKIKNFSNLIPGHGGVIDRIDCHILAGICCIFIYDFFYE
ncbi:Phosphatidate cytidylyltransferase [Giardia lamblia P15]|uniref:phosphatidate cytidylyltransferase n=1 Tax=Giardia intestinalis (strain P15) TaxID=658858 RepID=E1EZ17_GIAIA|nr:Phosphatidate cytidylyltransferase [Giardia lamblia P15]